jgi:hypothetical protein
LINAAPVNGLVEVAFATTILLKIRTIRV